MNNTNNSLPQTFNGKDYIEKVDKVIEFQKNLIQIGVENGDALRISIMSAISAAEIRGYNSYKGKK